MKNIVKTAQNADENWSELVAKKDNRIAELEALVKYYEEQFRLAKHRQFGVSSEKSEYDFGQLSLFNEAELFSDNKTAEPELVEIEKHYRQRTRLTTDKLPAEARENSLALVGKRYCDRLFGLDRSFADLSPEKRKQERTKTSKPKMEAFFAWADSCNAIPKSPVGKAVYYAKSQRKYLEHFLLDGRLDLSNNRAERSIRPFVIGRKNFLFANTPRGAKSTAILYSLIETAKENGLKPYDYLTLLFREPPKCQHESWDDFLPGGCSVPNSCRCPKPKQNCYAWEDDT